jgi:hypothetical protein
MTTKKKEIENGKIRILLEDKIDMSTLRTFEREQNIFMQNLRNRMSVKIWRYA